MGDKAVSQVVGVMLMIVIVVIIAAVVSGFAGGLVAKSNQKAPTLSMDVKVINNGYWHGSGFFATVTGVSEPIQTKDLKIVTSWKHSDNFLATAKDFTLTETGGNTTVANSPNINVLFAPNVTVSGVAPFGIGPGVNQSELGGTAGTEGSSFSSPWQQFGNYTLMPGTTLTAIPAGGARGGGSFGNSGESSHCGGYGADSVSYQYYSPEKTQTCYQYYSNGNWKSITNGCCDNPVSTSCSGYQKYVSYTQGGYTKVYAGQTYQQTVSGSSQPALGSGQYTYSNSCGSTCIDPAKAVLGLNWNDLRPGDSVNVRVIYIPTGKVIFNQDIPVTEA